MSYFSGECKFSHQLSKWITKEIEVIHMLFHRRFSTNRVKPVIILKHPCYIQLDQPPFAASVQSQMKGNDDEPLLTDKVHYKIVQVVRVGKEARVKKSLSGCVKSHAHLETHFYRKL